jgi:hypothetical protein
MLTLAADKGTEHFHLCVPGMRHACTSLPMRSEIVARCSRHTWWRRARKFRARRAARALLLR